MRWLSSQFSTRVIVLMPIAIASTSSSVSRSEGPEPADLPRLIGTILSGAWPARSRRARRHIEQPHLAVRARHRPRQQHGPFDQRAVSAYLPGGASWASIAHAASGTRLLAAAVGRDHRPRWRIYTSPAYADPVNGYRWVYAAIIGVAVVASVPIGGFIFLCRRWAGLCGRRRSDHGHRRAIVSAPIAAVVYGGVTGSGTDFIVLALRQGGADVYNASLGQGLFSDPIDKTITSFVVFIVLTSLSMRFLARFPLGERIATQGT